MGGVCITFNQEEGIQMQSFKIELGGVSQYSSKLLGQGVDVTLLNLMAGVKAASDPALRHSSFATKAVTLPQQ